jgi:hypothetical protein
LSRHLLPWTLAALVVVVPSGLVMFSARADELIASGPFKLKIALLLAAGMNAVFFRTAPYQGVAGWDRDATAPLAARLSAAASIALWFAIIACGRLLRPA